jgi:RNA polymerase sigma-70 factor (ECF subfamily)
MTAEELGDLSGLLERAAGGDAEALRAVFGRYRERLKRIVRLRLGRFLHGRVKDSDVVQAVCDEAGQRLNEYLQAPALPLFLWLRHLTCLKLAEVHSRHLGARAGDRADAGEVTLHGGGLPVADSVSLAAQLLGTTGTAPPSDGKAQDRIFLQEALNNLDPIDREVLALKHFEQLSFDEIALVLELSQASVGSRYLRALKRLREILPWTPGIDAS